MPHTPGPWKFRPETNAIVGAKHPVGESGNYAYETIGHLSGSPFVTLDERFSNARLIAAAPELLAALIKIDNLAREADTDANSQAVLALQVGVIAQVALAKINA